MESGKTVEEVAADFGIYRGNLTRWKREYLRDAEEAFPGMGKLKPENEELGRLKKRGIFISPAEYDTFGYGTTFLKFRQILPPYIN